MNKENLFAGEPYEAFVSFEGCRLQFALARKCRLYRFDKLIGIDIAVNFEHIDRELLYKLPLIEEQEDDGGPDDLYLSAKIWGWNVESKQFVDLGTYDFPIVSKDWAKQELRVPTEFLSENFEFTIALEYKLCRTSHIAMGLFKKHYVKHVYATKDPNKIELTTQITRVGGTNIEEETGDDVNSALEDLLSSRGI